MRGVLDGDAEGGELVADRVGGGEVLARAGGLALLERERDQPVGRLREAVAGILGSVRAMLGVLGLDPLDPQWVTGGSDARLTSVTDGLVSLALEQRQAARARKDFAAADAIRDQLTSLGVSVEDTPQGPRWELTH